MNGGPPVRTEPFPPRSVTTVEERDALVRLFDTAIADGRAIGYAGPEEQAFCSDFAATLGGGYADGVSSGTAALFVALGALDIEPYSHVVVGAITDPGGMMPIALRHCVPVVADTAAGCYSPGPDEIEAVITADTRAIVLPHIGGEPGSVEAIAELAAARSIRLVEDCAQAYGAEVGGRSAGTFGSVAVFSAMVDKHLSTGGQGGIVFTRDAELAPAVRRHADRGKAFGVSGGTNSVAALNLNMDEIHATLGRARLATLAERIEQRRAVAGAITAEVAAATGGAVVPAARRSGTNPSYWFLRLRCSAPALVDRKTEYCAAVIAEGVPLLGDPQLPHTFEWFRERRVFGSSGLPWSSAGDVPSPDDCVNAKAAVASHIHLPINERWGDREVEATLTALRKTALVFAGG